MDNNSSNDRATDFLVSTITLLAVAWLVYICRLYTRLWLIRCFFLEDYFITFAMVRLCCLLRADEQDLLTEASTGSSDSLRRDGASANVAWRRQTHH